ncbi:hypothetical protein M899_1049 [Bacteriovorax sp. BSW11_IV]|uniref:hypothetical protein n=1 Tax=Bacteriovorax sp. BSW11_IV TaxID=1353529 RepID=UPI000389EF93|nr:hypothetical protein [Bacteriovorax sp. BSW11_IV]EQC45206.1 hypothetical protein M899_1049 [Bacteriovorax sp. BSW11_IV]
MKSLKSIQDVEVLLYTDGEKEEFYPIDEIFFANDKTARLEMKSDKREEKQQIIIRLNEDNSFSYKSDLMIDASNFFDLKIISKNKDEIHLTEVCEAGDDYVEIILSL